MLLALWTLTAFALLLWSLSAWGLHSLLTLDPSWLDDVDLLIARMPFGATMELWFPGWQELLRVSIGLAQHLLHWVGGAAPFIVWIVWGVGTLILLLLSGCITLLVRLLRRRPVEPAPALATSRHRELRGGSARQVDRGL